MATVKVKRSSTPGAVPADLAAGELACNTADGKLFLGKTSGIVEFGSGMTNPMTTAGDIIIGGTSGAPTRLAKGTDGQVLTLASGLPSWADASGGSAAIDWANPVSVTTTANLTIGKHHVCSGTTADYTVTLPAVSGNAGKLLSVEMSGALTKLVTLDGNGSETIDGATTRVMWARETAVLLCDGVQWTKVGGRSISLHTELSKTNTQTVTSGVNTKILFNNQDNSNNLFLFDSTNNRILTKRPSIVSVTGFYYSNISSSSSAAVYIYKSGSGMYMDKLEYPAKEYYTFQINLTTQVSINTPIELYVKANVTNTAAAIYSRLILSEIPQW